MANEILNTNSSPGENTNSPSVECGILSKNDHEYLGPCDLFPSIIDNIKTGISVWGADNRLLIANSRFFEIVGIDKSRVPQHVTFVDFVELSVESSNLSGKDINELVGYRTFIISKGKNVSFDDEWPNGNIVAVEHRHIGNGCWMMTYDDITERRKEQSKVAFMAHHDSLTRLANRDYFINKLRDSLMRKSNIAILYIDLDKFKEINDTMGHPSGDALLRLVAARLSGCFRQNDVVARLGGDEFAVVVSNAQTDEQLATLSKRVIDTLGHPFEVEGHIVTIGASIGISFSQRDGHDPDVLLKNADMALYEAKEAGRNGFRFFEPQMGEKMRHYHKLEDDLRGAVKNDELELYYQPLVDTKLNRVVCLEALMRWHHPELGEVNPSDFIPIAEATGLISKLGAWALRRACYNASQWPSYLKIAVNLSPVQFLNMDIVDHVRDALIYSTLEPHRLEIEVTESVLIKDPDRANKIMSALKKLGICIAMDDFGTGYSSLSYLHTFSFDKIKIDKSFIASIGKDKAGDAVVKAVTRLAKDLDMKIVAEGVETEDQLDWLRREECSQVQGYLFSKPRPAREILNIIKEIDKKLENMSQSCI